MVYAVYVFLYSASMVAALGWNAPEQTPANFWKAEAALGWSPRPTSMPKAPRRDLVLEARSSLPLQRTCGSLLVSGTYLPETCSVGEGCAVNTNYYGANCCNAAGYDGTYFSSCTIYSACTPYDEIATALFSLTSTSSVVYCSDIVEPYCLTNTWKYGTLAFQQYGCTNVPNFGITITSDIDGTTSSTTPSTQTTSFTTSQTSAQQTQVVILEPHKDSTPTRAIVGGVVGGLALIALVIGLVFCFRRRSKKKAVSSQPAVSNPAMAQYPTNNGPPSGEAGFASHSQPQHGSNPYMSQHPSAYNSPDAAGMGAGYTATGYDTNPRKNGPTVIMTEHNPYMDSMPNNEYNISSPPQDRYYNPPAMVPSSAVTGNGRENEYATHHDMAHELPPDVTAGHARLPSRREETTPGMYSSWAAANPPSRPIEVPGNEGVRRQEAP